MCPSPRVLSAFVNIPNMNELIALGAFFTALSGIATFALYYYCRIRSSSNFRAKRVACGAKAYNILTHPDCSFWEKVFSLVSYLTFPVGDLANTSFQTSKKSGKNTLKTLLERFRKRLSQLEDAGHAKMCSIRNKNLQSDENAHDYLVGGTVIIPRDPKILIKWGLISEQDDIKMPLSQDLGSQIEILITCPMSCIEGDLEFENDATVNREGFRRFKTCKIEKLKFTQASKKLLWFHGGGMVLGSCKDMSPKFIHDIVNVCKYSTGSNKGEQCKRDSIVLMSVEYRLAPENPFPSPVIDGLSAACCLFDVLDDLHIAGISAGGNLATVVGLESFRKFGSKVKSIVAIDPMLDPTAHTSSYDLNASVYLFSPSKWLRWAWVSYLDIAVDEQVDFSNGLQHQTLLHKSHWREFLQKPIWRLACPFVDVPQVEDDERDAPPKIIVASSKADPLREDAHILVKRLREANHKVVHVEARGIHIMSRLFDKTANQEFMHAWNEALSCY